MEYLFIPAQFKQVRCCCRHFTDNMGKLKKGDPEGIHQGMIGSGEVNSGLRQSIEEVYLGYQYHDAYHDV